MQRCVTVCMYACVSARAHTRTRARAHTHTQVDLAKNTVWKLTRRFPDVQPPQGVLFRDGLVGSMLACVCDCVCV